MKLLQTRPEWLISGGILAVFVGILFFNDIADLLDEDSDPPPAQEKRNLRQMTLAQAIAHCRTLAQWQDWRLPDALAWSRERLDWYVTQGVDAHSLRHYACDGDQVTVGQRYQRPLAHRLPAATDAPRDLSRAINLFDRYTDLPSHNWIALEVAVDPQDAVNGALFERVWVNDRQPETPRSAGLHEFPTLFSQRPAAVTNTSWPALAPLSGATDWLKQPMQVMALLANHLPSDARISEIDVRGASVKVTIAGAIKNFDGKPPAPFGDATFDEYGIRDSTWWYPRDIGGCVPGYPLSEVSARLEKHHHLNNPRVFNAAFSCRQAAGSLARQGEWALRVPRSRR